MEKISHGEIQNVGTRRDLLQMRKLRKTEGKDLFHLLGFTPGNLPHLCINCDPQQPRGFASTLASLGDQKTGTEARDNHIRWGTTGQC